MDPKPLTIGEQTYNDIKARLGKVESKLSSVKVATPELINLLDNETPIDQQIEIMTDLLFEDIGGEEIISIVRNDIVNGQNVSYQPIKNITNLSYQYNPQNILALQKVDKDYFKNFPIILYNKVPECGTGFDINPENNGQVPNCQYIYIHPITGDLVIDLVNIRTGEQVEVQIISRLEELHDTIYSEDLES
jgi:hypothetical protein